MVIENGITMLFSFEHPLNVWLLMSVTEEGIWNCSNDEHPLNAERSIVVTEEGISDIHWKLIFQLKLMKKDLKW